MIKTIEINNFQAHEHSVLELHPGMNVIIGESNHGKTAILRALNLIRTNRPNTTRHVSHWARDRNKAGNIMLIGRMSVKLTNDTHVIERFRDGKENGYSVDGQKLLAVGTDVPAFIEKALNLSDVNFAGQHDPHFFLSWSPPEISRYLNSICGMSIMDKCLGIAIEAKNSAKKDADKLAVDKETHATALQNLQWVPIAQVELGKVQALRLKAFDTVQKSSLLYGLTHSAKTSQATVNGYYWLPVVKQSFTTAQMHAKECGLTWKKLGALKSLTNQVTGSQDLAMHHYPAIMAGKLLPSAKESLAQASRAKTKAQNVAILIGEILRCDGIRKANNRFYVASVSMDKAKQAIQEGKAPSEKAVSLRSLLTLISNMPKHTRDWKTAGDVLAKAKRSIRNRDTAKEDAKQLGMLLVQAKKADLDSRYWEPALASFKTEKEALARQLPKVCPTCGRNCECKGKV